MRALCLALLLVLAAALPGQAQDRATLVADSLSITGGDVLVAEGNVEVFHRGRHLRARRIAYDSRAGRLEIAGPITLTEGPRTVVLADQAALSSDLSEGILTSARVVFDRQLQLAASEIQRIGGRYTRLGRTVASSCRVCAGSATPLWEIRAARVVHDQQARQIYFDRAQLRFGGLPVAFIPRLRMPDPTLARANGFLMPEMRSSSRLGTGISAPYFVTLGASRDLTLTPLVTDEGTRALDLRYRQAFASGTVEILGALASDRLFDDGARGYVSAVGAFALPRDWRLTFAGITVSDPAYLRDYSLGDQDRLDSRVELSRTTTAEHLSARLTHFYSLREGEVNARLPSLVGDALWMRRFAPAGPGGTAQLSFAAQGRHRAANNPADSDGDGIADGRDTSRASLRATWRRETVVGPGIVAAALGDLALDGFDTRQDAAHGGTATRAAGGLAAELRWPLTRTTRHGAAQVLEPIAQFVLAAEDGNGPVPAEDSVLAEFDEGNLFAFDRLPGADAVERGSRANVGLAFTHYAPAGWSAGVTVGRVIRAERGDAFSSASGLDGMRSDWLAAIRLAGAGGLALTNRLILDEDLDVTKGELRLDLDRGDYALASSYVWMLADPAEDRALPVSEFVVDGRYRITPAWASRASTRYDFTADRAAEAAFGLEWRNECLRVDLSLSRRFTSSTSVQPTTDVGLSVELLGFGGASAAGPARACSG